MSVPVASAQANASCALSKRTANALCALTRIALEGVTTPLVKREDDAKFNAAKRKNNAKNNARITQNNAGVCGSRVESGAAYALYLRQLRADVGSNLEKYYPVLVNSNWLHGAANPRRSRLLGGLWSLYILWTASEPTRIRPRVQSYRALCRPLWA
jgi:hypothetical protein